MDSWEILRIHNYESTDFNLCGEIFLLFDKYCKL